MAFGENRPRRRIYRPTIIIFGRNRQSPHTVNIILWQTKFSSAFGLRFAGVHVYFTRNWLQAVYWTVLGLAPALSAGLKGLQQD